MSNYDRVRQIYAHELDDAPKASRFDQVNKKYNNEPGLGMQAVNAINYVGDNVLAPALGGATQTLGDIGASIGNLGLKPINALFGKDYNIPHPDLRKYFNQGGMGDAAFLGGQIAGGLIPGGGAIKGLQSSQRAGGYGGLATQAAKGAGVGYATGENDQGERGLATALGGAAGAGSSVLANGIQRRILADRARQMEGHGERYKEIFQSANNAGIRNPAVDVSGNDVSRIMKILPEKYKETISNVKNNPTIQGLHEAQSDLGKWIRKVESSAEAKTHTLPISQQRALEAAKRMREQIQKGITRSLGENNLLEESLAYPALTKSYAKNVAPYFTQAINDVATGKGIPNKLAKRLMQDEEFMLSMGKRYPEIAINNAMHSTLAKTLLGGGAALAGVPYGIKTLKEELAE